MARLNESTAPTESIEILKRRFVRQNREIARVNSIQSLRIRSLESEVSHLLSENVSLREQTISLGQELERYEAVKMLHDGVYDIKAKLDSKLAELGSLVTDLGALPRRLGKLCDERAESTGPGHSRLSNLDWRRRATDAEYHAVTEDGKLPVILEDKCYPRKTLDPQELRDIIHNEECSPRSPEIEEVTPIEKEEERIHFNPELPEGLAGYQIMDTDAEKIGTLLPPTLETRKKRKPSPVAVNKMERAFSPDAVPMHHDMNLSLKSGAKRKFMSEEAELFSSAATEDGDDDFQYSRASHLQSPEDHHTSIYDEFSPSKTQVEKGGGSRDRGSSKRKVLEPKSTNINAALSKRDRAVRDQKAQDKVHLQDTDCQYSTNGRREMSNQKNGMNAEPLAHDVNRSATEDDSVKHSVECRTSKQNSSSAPEIPEDEASSSALSATRPTRRQRSVVSYAEPNLRDKMRRPTSEFADAVTGGNPRRRSNIQSSHPNASDGGDNQINKDLSSKRSSYHFETIDGVQNPSFEIQEEDVASGNPMTTVSQRKRKTLPASSDGPSVEAMAPTHPTRHRSIYNGQLTDNEASLENDLVQKNSASSAKSATRYARRHSSNPRGQILASESGTGSTGEAKRDQSRVNPTGTLALDYDESMLAISNNTSLGPEACTQSMNSQTDVERGMVSGTDGRARRTGTRRRSMMI
ncbi:shugoshin family protein [Aspergillus chevalieri]|uniref:Shugoshin n=1 Tax=Aspergillus chevalieri TaxID=182096 RepID=A0A7R7VM63_ASPCH|nr:uncharacterized protein ACHE_31009S [Aspergillus chevalieri]BCR87022.1 hypothetical protein ACHE_31009S [Aspergillus chevalieri]